MQRQFKNFFLFLLLSIVVCSHPNRYVGDPGEARGSSGVFSYCEYFYFYPSVFLAHGEPESVVCRAGMFFHNIRVKAASLVICERCDVAVNQSLRFPPLPITALVRIFKMRSEFGTVSYHLGASTIRCTSLNSIGGSLGPRGSRRRLI